MNGTMRVPVVVDSQQYSRSNSLMLGERVAWEMVWNEPFARWWAGLRPGWNLTVQLQPAKGPKVTRVGATPADDIEMQPSVGSRGNLRFGYTARVPIPHSLTVSGALRMTGGSARHQDLATPSSTSTNEAYLVTSGTLARIQLVSILVDLRPGSFPQWSGFEPIAGTEWFYELAAPPERLHNYRSAEGPPTCTREEILLIELEVDP